MTLLIETSKDKSTFITGGPSVTKIYENEQKKNDESSGDICRQLHTIGMLEDLTCEAFEDEKDFSSMCLMSI